MAAPWRDSWLGREAVSAAGVCGAVCMVCWNVVRRNIWSGESQVGLAWRVERAQFFQEAGHMKLFDKPACQLLLTCTLTCCYCCTLLLLLTATSYCYCCYLLLLLLLAYPGAF